jgi:hypothetical protein
MPPVQLLGGRGPIVLDIADARLAFHFPGPPDLSASDLTARIDEALDAPVGYPPLVQQVVPGDSVVLVADPNVAATTPGLLPALARRLRQADVGSIELLMTSPPASSALARPIEVEGATIGVRVHDRSDAAALAYLASTEGGQRIYLDRAAIDADVVIPIGRAYPESTGGLRGPWTEVYPGLGDAEAGGDAETGLDVSWLLGSLFQVALLPGARGVAGVFAGEVRALRERVDEELAGLWTVPPGPPADLLVLGIGRSGQATGWDEVARGVANALPLVRAGGLVAVATNLDERPGPGVEALGTLDGGTLRIPEGAADAEAARRLAAALAHARVALMSGLTGELVEDLGFAVLDEPAAVQRLVDRQGGTVSVVNRPEFLRLGATARRD